MLSADPVMKAEMEVSEIRSTIQPHLINPMNVIIQPAITARADAMIGPGILGWVTCAFVRICPVRVDMTATGYMKVSHTSR
jgi:hypothetical protein